MEGYWRISDFADKIGKHSNTIDRWFNDMERRRIHFVNRSEDGDKVYNSLDLEIGMFIRDRREEKWNLAAIYSQLEDLFDLRPFPKEEDTSVPQVVDLETMQRNFTEQMQEAIEVAVQNRLEEILARLSRTQAIEAVVEARIVEMMKQLPKPRDPVEERQQRVNEWIAVERVKAKLRKEALELWYEKPDQERIKKTGFLGLKKEEDRDKRDQFVKGYIDKNFATYLRQEINVD